MKWRGKGELAHHNELDLVVVRVRCEILPYTVENLSILGLIAVGGVKVLKTFLALRHKLLQAIDFTTECCLQGELLLVNLSLRSAIVDHLSNIHYVVKDLF